MIEIQGTYNTARVFTDTIEDAALSQIVKLLNETFVSGSSIRIKYQDSGERLLRLV